MNFVFCLVQAIGGGKEKLRFDWWCPQCPFSIYSFRIVTFLLLLLSISFWIWLWNTIAICFSEPKASNKSLGLVLTRISWIQFGRVKSWLSCSKNSSNAFCIVSSLLIQLSSEYSHQLFKQLIIRWTFFSYLIKTQKIVIFVTQLGPFRERKLKAYSFLSILQNYTDITALHNVTAIEFKLKNICVSFKPSNLKWLFNDVYCIVRQPLQMNDNEFAGNFINDRKKWT